MNSLIHTRLLKLLCTVGVIGLTQGLLLGYAQAQTAEIRNVFTCSGKVTLDGTNEFDFFQWSPATSLSSTTTQKVQVNTRDDISYTLTARKLDPENLVVNGDFEAGIESFTSQYAPFGEQQSGPGTYTVAATALEFEPKFLDCFDAEGGASQYLIADGSETPEQAVWCQEVEVAGPGFYQFAFSHAPLSNGVRDGSVTPAAFTVSFNGEVVDERINTSFFGCTWQRSTLDYQFTGAKTIEICIIERTGVTSGNDFAIDNISLKAAGAPTTVRYDVQVGANSSREQVVEVCAGGRWTEYGYNLTEGSAVVKFAGSGQCDSFVTFIIREGTPKLDSSVVEGLCLGDPYEYQDRNGRRSIIRSDTVLRTAFRQSNGCDSIVSRNVNFFGPEDLEPLTVPPTCAEGSDGSLSIAVTAGGAPYTYRWDDSASPSRARQNLSTGAYTLEVSDSRGCVATRKFGLGAPNALSLDEVSAQSALCPEEFGRILGAPIGGSGSITQRFTALDDSSVDTTTGILPGEYLLSVADSAGCETSKPLTFSPPAPLSIELSGDSFLYIGQQARHSVIVNPPELSTSLEWTYRSRPLPPQFAGLLSADQVSLDWSPPGPGLLRVGALSALGCEVFDQLFVRYQALDTEFFPSAFSPNGDDLNDSFSPVANPGFAELRALSIVDRWGNLMWRAAGCSTTGLEACAWNGQGPGGLDVPTGVYTYVATLLLTNGAEQQYMGTVHLFR